MKYLICLATLIIFTSCSFSLDVEKFSKAYSDCAKLMNYMNGTVDRVVYNEGEFWCKGTAPDPVKTAEDYIKRDHYSLNNDVVGSVLYAIELMEHKKIILNK